MNVSLAYIGFIIGAVIELFRIAQPKRALQIILGSIAFGAFSSFLPDKKETTYILAEHIAAIPMNIAMILVLIGGIYMSIKTEQIKRHSEGSTLVASLCLTYLFFELEDQAYFTFFTIPALLFCLYHCFTNTPLRYLSRLFLGFWSGLVGAVLAFRLFMNLHSTESVEALMHHGLYDFGALTFMQFVVVGVSSFYILENLMYFVMFFPWPKEVFKGEYLKNLDENIQKVSEAQIDPRAAVLVVAIISIFFVLNYSAKFMSFDLAIFIVLSLSSFMLPGLIRQVESKPLKQKKKKLW